MAQTDYGELTYHGLDCWTYNEAETGISGENFGEGDWHGLDVLVYDNVATVSDIDLRRRRLYQRGGRR
jgi:hypothetical protein